MNVCLKKEWPKRKTVAKSACACSPSRCSGTVCDHRSSVPARLFVPAICFPPITRPPTAFWWWTQVLNIAAASPSTVSTIPQWSVPFKTSFNFYDAKLPKSLLLYPLLHLLFPSLTSLLHFITKTQSRLRACPSLLTGRSPPPGILPILRASLLLYSQGLQVQFSGFLGLSPIWVPYSSPTRQPRTRLSILAKPIHLPDLHSN